MTKPSAFKRLQEKKMNAARSVWQVINTTPPNLIDLSSSEKYESTNSNENENLDDDFVEDDDELDDNRGANSIIDCLLAASKANFEKKGRPKIYTGLSACTRQRKKKALKDTAVGSLKITSFFSATNTQLLAIDDDKVIGDHSFSDRECSDSESEDEESLINNAIEFVNKILNEKMVSKTERTHYTAVLYFLQLLLDGQEKMKASETVVKVVNGGP
ncbi:15681_t:CDS:1 [Cetraspora pellucida]|uniref:15681_t:CDS:1 n=1 Tax=Cetraspora pellucida TaxID=1433469 RepID=A0ACA9KRP4_9GLOM|nr:15681_t:CDS:1 [Cetraspora pellucida]